MTALNKKELGRTGFSLIELLVVIAIIGTLVSMLLAAVQQAREAANRAVCQNNLKQLALGIHLYSDAHTYLPTMWSSSDEPGWMLQIFPYIEEDNLYNAFNFNVTWYDSANANLVNQRLRVGECPSNPVQPRVFTETDTAFSSTDSGGTPLSTFSAASVDYYALSGASSYTTFYPGSTADVSGIMGPQQADTKNPTTYRFDLVTDGLSNTIMLSEMAGRPWLFVTGGQQPTSAPSYDKASNGGTTQNPLNYGFGSWAQNNNFGATVFSTNGMATWSGSGTPCVINCSNYRGMYSFHIGVGVYAAFGDGSVHLLPQGMSAALVEAMITARGGESITGFNY